MPVKILVTGASGFIGGFLAERLAQNTDLKIDATGRSHTDRFSRFPTIHYFHHDLTKPLPEQEAEVCIHCAGLADDRATPEAFALHNETALQHLIRALPHCRLFIFMSSASVYDFSDEQPKREPEAVLSSNLSAYGQSKLRAEELLPAGTFPAIYILRPRAVYGPGDRVLMPRLLRLICGGRLWRPRHLASHSSLTHIENLCEAIQKILQQQVAGRNVLNIADTQTYDLGDVLGEIAKHYKGVHQKVNIPNQFLEVLSKWCPKVISGSALTPQALDYLTLNSVLDVSQAKAELDYEGKWNLADFLP